MMDGTRRSGSTARWMVTALALLAMSGALLTGCSSTDYRDVRITTDYDDNADFAAIKTWAWLPKEPAPIRDPRVHDSTAHERLRRAIKAELKARGLTEATGGAPDVWVHHTVWLMARSDLPKLDAGSPTRRTEEPQKLDDDEGGLLIELRDGKTRKRVWAAQVRAMLTLEVPPEQKEKRVREIVRRMLEDYPPAAWRKAMQAE